MRAFLSIKQPTLRQAIVELVAQLSMPDYKRHGRNVPCPCGSGRRFKHGCGAKDGQRRISCRNGPWAPAIGRPEAKAAGVVPCSDGRWNCGPASSVRSAISPTSESKGG